MSEQNAQPSTVRWPRVITHVAGVLSLVLLGLAFFTFNAPVLLISVVLAIVGLVFGLRARAEIGITLAVLSILGTIAFIVGLVV